RPHDLHELAPPRRGPGGVRRRGAPEPWGTLDPRVCAGALPGRGHIDDPGDVPPPRDAAGPRGPRRFARGRGGQAEQRLDGRPPDHRRPRGTGARARGDDRPRAEGHHVPAPRLLAGATLPRPHPGVGSPVTPSPLAQIATVAAYEIRKYIRGRRLLGMLILLGLIVRTAGLSLYYGAAAIAALVITGSLTWDVGLSYLYTLGYMTAVVGVAYLLSALLKGTVAATVLTFFLFTLIFSIIGGILPRANVEPWFIPTSASGIIANALGGPAVRPGPGGGAVGFIPGPAPCLL